MIASIGNWVFAPFFLAAVVASAVGAVAYAESGLRVWRRHRRAVR